MFFLRAKTFGVIFFSALLSAVPAAGQNAPSFNGQARLDPQGNVYVSSNKGKLIKVADVGHCAMVMVAEDKQTVGCLVRGSPMGVEPPPPPSTKLEVFERGGKKITLQPGSAIRDWHFVNEGKQISIYSGPANGSAEFTLYDVSTGRVLNEMPEPTDNNPRPEWAKTRMQVLVDSVPSSPELDIERTKWITKVLWEISKIRPGMQRKDLLKIFTTEGGLSNRFQRTYVYRGCPYIKVNVRFKAVGDPDQALMESPEDIIETISGPYLAFGFSG